MIQAIIFDMDGVLTDSEPIICAAAMAMFRERGVAVQPEDFRPFVGTGENRYIGGVAEKYGVDLDILEAKRRTYQIYLELVEEGLDPFPGARELVAACRRANLRIAVASSADRIKIEANLRKIGLPWKTWDAVVTGEDVQKTKPAPDIFLKAADQLRVEPNLCAVVEDAPSGIAAARAAGMYCIAVAQTFPVTRLGQADMVYSSLREVAIEDFAGHPPET